MTKLRNFLSVYEFPNAFMLLNLLLFIFPFSEHALAQKKAPSLQMDYSMIPTYGEITLDTSFGESPYEVAIISGGEINASYHGGECSGFVSQSPDFRLQWDGSANQLVFYFLPDNELEDATILVNLPDGSWVCNDDAEPDNLNPLALVESPQTGQYDIWVGSYEEGQYIEGKLYIADIGQLSAGEIETLDFSLDPQYSVFNLREGFSPDPYSISGVSGGEIEVEKTGIGEQCIGFASKAPDFRLNWTGSTTDLKIRFEANSAGDDTVLIINTPDGQWLCNDDEDSNTLNPMVSLKDKDEGQYDIWVASLNKGEYIEGKLIVTEH